MVHDLIDFFAQEQIDLRLLVPEFLGQRVA
jgi:hypothetical protein